MAWEVSSETWGSQKSAAGLHAARQKSIQMLDVVQSSDNERKRSALETLHNVK